MTKEAVAGVAHVSTTCVVVAGLAVGSVDVGCVAAAGGGICSRCGTRGSEVAYCASDVLHKWRITKVTYWASDVLGK